MVEKLFSDIIVLKNIGRELGVEWDDEDKGVYERDERIYSIVTYWH